MMATSQPITLNNNNDEDIDATITTNVPVPGTTLNITGFTIEAYFKTTAATSDTDPSTWKGSTATSGVTITDGPNGKISIAIPAASVVTSVGWYRVDVISAGKRKTAVYGTVAVHLA